MRTSGIPLLRKITGNVPYVSMKKCGTEHFSALNSDSGLFTHCTKLDNERDGGWRIFFDRENVFPAIVVTALRDTNHRSRKSHRGSRVLMINVNLRKRLEANLAIASRAVNPNDKKSFRDFHAIGPATKKFQTVCRKKSYGSSGAIRYSSRNPFKGRK